MIFTAPQLPSGGESGPCRGALACEISWMAVNSRTLSSKGAQLSGKGIQRMSLNRTTMGGGATEAANRAAKETAN
jgi:uncharacterized protein